MISILAGLFFLISISAILTLRFERPGGLVERGFTIWSEQLAPDLTTYLAQLSEGFRVEGVFSPNADFFHSFIRKEQHLALIRVAHSGRGSWPWKYLGVVNLKISPAIIDYRIQTLVLLGSIFVLLLSFVEYFISGFNSQTLLIPVFFLLITVAGHFVERNRILSYLKACMKEDSEKIPSRSNEDMPDTIQKSVTIDRRSYIAKIRGYDQ